MNDLPPEFPEPPPSLPPIPLVLTPPWPSPPIIPQIPPSFWRLWVTFAVVTLLGITLQGWFAENALALWQILPVVGVGMLAYLGEHRPVAVIFAWLGTAGCLCLTGLTVLVLTLVDILPNHADPHAQQLGQILPLFGLLLVSIGLIGLAWLPCYGRGLDAGSRLRTRIAAVLCCGISAMLVVPLISPGRPPLLNPAVLASMTGPMGVAELARLEILSALWIIVGSFCLVGYATKRSFAEALDRLGLVRPTLRFIGISVGAAAIFFALNFGLEMGVNTLWEWCHFPTTDQAALQKLFGEITSPAMILIMSLGAGITEELAIRGVLQPRVGLISANLFFMALHALQYHWGRIDRGLRRRPGPRLVAQPLQYHRVHVHPRHLHYPRFRLLGALCGTAVASGARCADDC